MFVPTNRSTMKTTNKYLNELLRTYECDNVELLDRVKESIGEGADMDHFRQFVHGIIDEVHSEAEHYSWSGLQELANHFETGIEVPLMAHMVLVNEDYNNGRTIIQ